MADVTFTIEMQDDGTPVLKKFQGEAVKVHEHVGQSADRLGARYVALGQTLSVALTVPLVAAGTAAIKLSSDFDTSLSRITGLVGVAQDQVAAWRDDLLTLGPELGKGPRELADALFFVTSAGYRGAEAIDVLTISAKASAAGMGQTETIANLLTSAITAYGQANLSAGKAGGILAAAVREGKAAADQLGPAMGQLLPVAQSLGVGFDELAAALAAMSRIESNVGVASTQFGVILQALQAPTEQAKEVMEQLGLSAESLRRQIDQEGLLSVLEKLKESFGTNVEAAARFFGSKEALTGFLNLMGENAESTRQVFASLAEEMGVSLTKAMDAAADTAGHKMQQALSAISVLLIRIGDEVLPHLVPLLERATGALSHLTTGFTNLSPFAQQVLVGLAALTAVGGPLVLLIGQLTLIAGLLGPIGIGLAALGVAVAAGSVLWLKHAGAIAEVEAELKKFSAAEGAAAQNDAFNRAMRTLVRDVIETGGALLEAEGFAEAFGETLKNMTAAGRTLAPDVAGPIRDIAKALGIELPAAYQATAAGATAAGASIAEVTDKIKAFREATDSQIATLRDQVATFGLSAQAVVEYEAAQLRAQGATEAQVATFTRLSLSLLEMAAARDAEKNALDELDKSLKAEKDAYLAVADEIIKADQARESAIQKTAEQIAANQEETRIIHEGIAAGRVYDDVLRDIAIAKQEAALEAQGLTENVRETASAMVDSAREVEAARDDLERYKGVTLDLGDVVGGAWREVATGIFQGTQSIKQILSSLGDFGVGIFIDMFGRIIEEKLAWEVTLSGNILNDLPNLFAKGAELAASLFGSSLINASQVQWQAFSTSNATQLNQLVQTFPGAGAKAGASYGEGIVAGLSGYMLGEGARQLFGIGQSTAGSIGAGIGAGAGGIAGFIIGGPGGAAIGSALGDIVGGFFGDLIGDLFKHIPTGGTQVRGEMVDWLRSLDVAFSDEIKKSVYGFQWIKDYADQTNTNFLEASKEFIPQNFAELVAKDLDKQLTALGLLTKDAAENVGKDLNQTVITFANQIAANLGDSDKVAAFITDLVDKAGVSLAGLVQVANEAFDSGVLSADLYKVAIEGAVSIFTSDLPAAINVSKLAMESFTDDGIFSLSVFEEKLRSATENFVVGGEAAASAWNQGFAEGLDSAEVREAFLKQLEDMQTAAITQAQQNKLAETLFEGIDLTQPLDDTQAQILADRVAVAYDNTLLLLDAAGRLPEAFQDAADAAGELGNGVGGVVGEWGDIDDTIEAGTRHTTELTAEANKWKKAIQDVRREYEVLQKTARGVDAGEFFNAVAARAETLSGELESALTQGLQGAWETGGSEAAMSLIGANLQQTVFTAVLNALAASAVLPLLQPLIAGMATAGEALASGMIDSATYAATIQALLEGTDMDQVKQAMLEALRIAGEVSKTLESTEIPGVSGGSAGGGVVGGAAGGAPRDHTLPPPADRSAFDAAMQAINAFIAQGGQGLTALLDTVSQLDTDAEQLGATLLQAARDNAAALGLNWRQLKDLEATFSSTLDALEEAAEQAQQALITAFRADLLDPIQQALDALQPPDLTPLADIITAIAQASAPEDLILLREQALESITARYDRERTLAEEVSEARIAALQEEEDAVSRLIDLRTALIQQEISAIDEQLRALDAVVRQEETAFNRLIQLRTQGLQAEIRAINERQRAAEAAARQEETDFNRLIQLRTQLIQQEISAIDEQLRALDEQQSSAEQLLAVSQSLQQTVDSLRVGPQSFATPEEQVSTLQAQFRAAVLAAQGGDTEAAQLAAQLGPQLIGLARDTYASGQRSLNIFDEVEGALGDLAEQFGEQALQQLSQIDIERAALEAARAALESQLLQEDLLGEIADLNRELGLTGRESLSQLAALNAQVAQQREREIEALDIERAALESQLLQEDLLGQIADLNEELGLTGRESLSQLAALKAQVAQQREREIEALDIEREVLEAARSALESQLLQQDLLSEIADLNRQLGLTGAESLAELVALKDTFAERIAGQEDALIATLEEQTQRQIDELQQIETLLGQKFDRLIQVATAPPPAPPPGQPAPPPSGGDTSVLDRIRELLEKLQQPIAPVTIRIEAPNKAEIKTEVYNDLWSRSRAGTRVIDVRGVWSDSGQGIGGMR